ncbi:hypothetical protein LY90DRAFT_505849 [Neocallimastix californiae]|uniref:Uncharacterized protein n=1 Tax=Neocallimastix californiae TaxID=1754190 RepID=A0A1Y2DLZ2_9FUNG|nr:hypothetical protein LY90DRAFT_505849 [Neocallimastix californiae]|eukprot:ORY60328.1 hypothetical protein LY90DRAFT_505849 [Neocallimastix californiae]
MDIISMIHLNNGTNEWEDSGYASISQSKNTSYKASQKFLILPSNFNMKLIKSSTKKLTWLSFTKGQWTQLSNIDYKIPTNSSLFINKIGHTLSCGIWNFQNELLFM